MRTNISGCQFPMWGLKTTHVYCNCKTKENSPYCAKHHKLCYEKTRSPLIYKGSSIQIKFSAKPEETVSKVSLKKVVKGSTEPKTRVSSTTMEAR